MMMLNSRGCVRWLVFASCALTLAACGSESKVAGGSDKQGTASSGKAAASKVKMIWKLEDGPEDAPEAGSPEDVGPAWLHAPGTKFDQQDIAGGKWITRAEAKAIAEENGYELDVDD